MDDRIANLAKEAMYKIKEMKRDQRPKFLGEEITLLKPNNPSDNQWENMLQSRCRVISKLVAALFFFLIGFLGFAFVVYNLKNKQQTISDFLPSENDCNSLNLQYKNNIPIYRQQAESDLYVIKDGLEQVS